MVGLAGRACGMQAWPEEGEGGSSVEDAAQGSGREGPRHATLRGVSEGWGRGAATGPAAAGHQAWRALWGAAWQTGGFWARGGGGGGLRRAAG